MAATIKASIYSMFIVHILQLPLLAQTPLKNISQLTADSSGWLALKEMLRTAKNHAEILPATLSQARPALQEAQVTTRSTLGAVIFYTGGIFVDHGWIRILGSGSDKLARNVMEWNKGKTYQNTGDKPGFLLVADDAAGGFYAINGGALGKDAGNVYYLAPDDLEWQSLERGYTDFIDFVLNGDLNTFYKNLRWKTWADDVKKLAGNQVYTFYPYLWTKEGKNIDSDTKKVISVSEQYLFNMNSRAQLGIK